MEQQPESGQQPLNVPWSSSAFTSASFTPFTRRMVCVFWPHHRSTWIVNFWWHLSISEIEVQPCMYYSVNKSFASLPYSWFHPWPFPVSLSRVISSLVFWSRLFLPACADPLPMSPPSPQPSFPLLSLPTAYLLIFPGLHSPLLSDHCGHDSLSCQWVSAPGKFNMDSMRPKKWHGTFLGWKGLYPTSFPQWQVNH